MLLLSLLSQLTEREEKRSARFGERVGVYAKMVPFTLLRPSDSSLTSLLLFYRNIRHASRANKQQPITVEIL